MSGVTVNGTPGNDNLVGGAGADTITGGQGNDTLSGGAESDLYLYSAGDGSDQIREGTTWGLGTADSLRFVDLDSGAVSLARSGNHLVITLKATGDTIVVSDHYAGLSQAGIESISFADGITWSRLRIENLIQTGGTLGEAPPIFGTDSADSIVGTSYSNFIYGEEGPDTIDGGVGNDTIYAGHGENLMIGGIGDDLMIGGQDADTIMAGVGSDSLSGGKGNDLYVYSSGDGSDTIYDTITSGGFDRLEFTDLTSGAVSLARVGNHLVVTLKASGEKITVYEHYTSFSGVGIEEIKFSDGVIWTRAQFETLIQTGGTLGEAPPIFGTDGAESISGTSYSDFMYGEHGADTLDGGVGNDSIYGGHGDNLMIGGVGDDYLRGGQNGDTFIGGQGADTLVGTAGADLYLYASGDGADVIDESNISTGADRLEFTDLASGAVSLSRVDKHLLITLKATGEIIKIHEHYDSFSGVGIEDIKFADGVIWTRAQIETLIQTGGTLGEVAPTFGTDGDDSILGTSHSNFIYGELGADTLDGGAGNDSIYGGHGANHLSGGDGNDLLHSGNDGDTLIGGLGDDQLTGGAGADVYLYASGDGTDNISELGTLGNDTLEFTDIGPGGVSLAKVGVNLVVTVKATGHQITVGGHYNSTTGSGIEFIKFADGVTWNRSQIDNLINTGGTTKDGAPIVATTGDDSIVGTNLSEVILGDTGNDTLAGGTGGDDGLYGEAGNDSLNGEGGADVLDGNAGDDSLVGGLGDDQLAGGAGGDVYFYASGDGADNISELGTLGNDILQFTDIGPGGVSLAKVGLNLVVTVKATGQQITVGGHYNSQTGSGIEFIKFADGVTWNRSQIDILINTGGTTKDGAPIVATAGGDSIAGTNLSEVILGDAGNDTLDGGTGGADGLYGEGGNDSLNGGTGADVLDGGAGDDSLVGGLGDDQLTGGAGADVYRYASGDGVDSISELGTLGNDTLEFTDIGPGGVSLAKVGLNLVVTVKATGQQITVAGHYGSATGSGVEFIKFSDGVTWNRAQIDILINTGGTTKDGAPIVATTSDNNIVGTNLSEVILGDAGNDTLHGGTGGDDGLYGETGNDSLNGGGGADTLDGNAGDDSLVGGLGDDQLAGGAGGDVYFYASGDGVDSISELGTLGNDILQFTDIGSGGISLAKVGLNLVATVKATGQQITIAGHYASTTGSGIEAISFSDGVTWTRAQIETLLQTGGTLGATAPVFGTTGADSMAGSAQGDFLYGEAGNDTIDGGLGDDRVYDGLGDNLLFGRDGNDILTGGSGADTLTGGQGADALSGGAGGDLYLYALGDGSDTISEGQANFVDRVEFVDVDSAGVRLSKSGSNLVLTLKANNETITIVNHYASVSGAGVEELKFSDGVVWTKGNIENLIAVGATNYDGAPVIGTTGNDSLVGSNLSQYLLGDTGDDTINGMGGDDTMWGSAGDDLFIFQPGFGNDRIQTFTAGGALDELDFTALAGTGLTPTVTQVGADTLITYGADSVRLVGVTATQLVQTGDYLFA